MLDVPYSQITTFANLSDIAALNPRLEKKLAPDTPVAFVPMAGLSAEKAEIVGEETRSYSDVAKGYTPFQDGDLLVAKITPCFENNKIGHARLSRRDGFGSTEFHVIRPHADKTDARYLLHFLRQDHVRAEGARRMTGSAGQRRVPEHFLASLNIPIPPLAEQRRIAAILDQADALRAKRRAALAQLDEMARAIFVEMFGDSLVNPFGWDDSNVLGGVADIVSGVTVGRKVNGQSVRTVPYLAVSNVQDRALNLKTVKTIQATEDEIARYSLKQDDIVVTEGGDPDKLGRGVLWNAEIAECIHQNHIFRIRLRSPSLHPVFLVWLVGSSHGKRYFLRAAKQTTGIASINMGQLRAFPLLIPPIELQNRFVERLGGLQVLRRPVEAAREELDSLFTSLQHRAFRGEL